MRILIVLTYYRPHTSGLTIYVERLANALERRGHQVTILTSRYDRSLPGEERQGRVRIVRVPVLLRISKGVVMPTFGLYAARLLKEHDVVNLHLPQFDAALVAMIGRALKRPVVLTYHCDLLMPPGALSQLANGAIHVMNHLSAIFAHKIVTYTQDYADHSAYLTRYRSKIHILQPPVVLPQVTDQEIKIFANQFGLNEHRPIIGMAARFAAEKGVEVLLEAMPAILKAHPKAMVLFAGPYVDIVGEKEYAARLFPLIHDYETRGNWKFMGVLDPKSMAAFYPNLDVLVVPSLNSTEAFGLVQIEAMMNGVPVVASALPGVRQPVLSTGMGEIIPVGDAKAVAQAVLAVLGRRGRYAGEPETISQRFSPESVARGYEALFQELEQKIRVGK